jgi:hypothetical protein
MHASFWWETGWRSCCPRGSQSNSMLQLQLQESPCCTG